LEGLIGFITTSGKHVHSIIEDDHERIEVSTPASKKKAEL